jgi:hypothetical protein
MAVKIRTIGSSGQISLGKQHAGRTAMMLDHIGESEKAGQVRDAVAAVVREGKVRTYDMMRLAGGGRLFRKGRPALRG